MKVMTLIAGLFFVTCVGSAPLVEAMQDGSDADAKRRECEKDLKARFEKLRDGRTDLTAEEMKKIMERVRADHERDRHEKDKSRCDCRCDGKAEVKTDRKDERKEER